MRCDRIEKLLSEKLAPQILKIEDESHLHSGPRVESHFKILIVSSIFEGENRVWRQRTVQGLLEEEFENGLHALSLRCLTPEEASAAHKEKASNHPIVRVEAEGSLKKVLLIEA